MPRTPRFIESIIRGAMWRKRRKYHRGFFLSVREKKYHLDVAAICRDIEMTRFLIVDAIKKIFNASMFFLLNM